MLAKGPDSEEKGKWEDVGSSYAVSSEQEMGFVHLGGSILPERPLLSGHFLSNLDSQRANCGGFSWMLSWLLMEVPELCLLGEPETRRGKFPGPRGKRVQSRNALLDFLSMPSPALGTCCLGISGKGVISTPFCSQGASPWPECRPMLAAARIPAAQANLYGPLTHH